MAISPTVQVQDGTNSAVSVATGATVTVGNQQVITLVSSTGVTKWDCYCIWTNDTTVPPRVNASSQVIFTPSQAGLGYIFKSTVNGPNATETSYTFALFVTDVGGAKIAWPSNQGAWSSYLQSLQAVVAPQLVENFSAQVSAVVYGDGSDGACTFDGTNTFAFASKASSVYTLTRDVYLASGSVVNSGVTLKTAGFRVFCNGTLTNSGTIHNDGNAGAANVAGGSSAVGTLGIGTAGGAGHTAAAGAGTAGTNQTNVLGDAACAGGAGGAAGANAGGAAGTYTASAANGGANHLFALSTGFLTVQTGSGSTATVLPIGGGAGGGGGGNDASTSSGGGGGGGGGVMILHVFNLVNSGAIHCNGGNGGNGTGSAGNAGGGGGGGGGIILQLSRIRSGSGTMTCSGGSGGTGFGTGGTGSAGSAGKIYQQMA